MAMRILETAVNKENEASEHSSSNESDETLIQSELLKIPSEPELKMFSENGSIGDRSSVDLEPRSSPRDSELGDDEKSVSNSQTDSYSSKVEQFSPPRRPSSDSLDEENRLSPGEIEPVTTMDQPDVSARSTIQQKPLRSTQTEAPRQPDNKTQRNILAEIKETNNLKKAVDKEIKKRKKLLKQQLGASAVVPKTTTQVLPIETCASIQPTFGTLNKRPKVKEMEPSQAQSSQKVPPSTLSHFSRIPRLMLSSSIVKASVKKVAGRRRLANSYSVLSEILTVKQVLAKGNPFHVIPQHAYDISKVPGIRLPHIQQLLKQWETYFSNILYQVVQIEYSMQYGDVERRIAALVEGGEAFGALFEFQSFIGKEEVTVRKTKSDVSIDKQCAGEDGPSVKKSRTDKSVAENQRSSASKVVVKRREPLLKH